MTILERILNQEFTGVFIDSRNPIAGGLFIPIRGEQFNGNSFIKHAFEGGAKAALVEEAYYRENQAQLEQYDLIIVPDSLQALHSLAASVRRKIAPKVIGVTGSNGKTTVKNMLESICRLVYRTYATKGNFNNDIGLPLMILNMPPDTEVLILEMGMNHAGEIALLSQITRPDIAVITNIGTSHIEFFGGNISGIRDAKLEIIRYMDVTAPLYINGDDPMLNDFNYQSRPVIRVFRNQLRNISSDDGFYQYQLDELAIKLHVRGEHQVDNSHLAVVVSRDLGISDDVIEQGIRQYEGASMRFATMKLGNLTVINDAYNASPMSMIAAIKTLLAMKGGRKIAVLGDIFELGSVAKQEHVKIGDYPGIQQLDGLYTIGDYTKYIAPTVTNRQHFSNIQKLCEFLLTIIRPDDIILAKASRGMQLERVVRFLEENYHD